MRERDGANRGETERESYEGRGTGSWGSIRMGSGRNEVREWLVSPKQGKERRSCIRRGT